MQIVLEHVLAERSKGYIKCTAKVTGISKYVWMLQKQEITCKHVLAKRFSVIKQTSAKVSFSKLLKMGKLRSRCSELYKTL